MGFSTELIPLKIQITFNASPFHDMYQIFVYRIKSVLLVIRFISPNVGETVNSTCNMLCDEISSVICGNAVNQRHIPDHIKTPYWNNVKKQMEDCVVPSIKNNLKSSHWKKLMMVYFISQYIGYTCFEIEQQDHSPSHSCQTF